MKKALILLLLELLTAKFVYASDTKAIIQLKNDSIIEVIIKIRKYPLSLKGAIKYPLLQNEIEYYDSTGKKIKLKPEQIKEVRFNYKGEEIKMQTIILKHRLREGLGKSSDYVLLKLKTDGNKMKRFLYFHNSNFMGIHLKMVFNVLQKGNGEGFVPQWFNNFKNITKYVSECPSLVDKINNDIYNSQNVKDIVKDYNICVQ